MRLAPFILSLLASLAIAAPTASNPTNFFLVTTTQRAAASNSSELKHVNATSLFDPYYQTNYLLRLIAAGYIALPQFNLTDGTLHTIAEGPHGVGTYDYNSTKVTANHELQFSPSKEKKGNLALKDGYLLTVNGQSRGWTICLGQLDELVLEWKGNDTSCKHTYIQAVTTAPY